ncbi:MAG TPA: phosphate ABC transporter ATP-binding protein PstB, partial [Nitrososphaerales archaeon]|nr:phosphate ABC transporter ATP-binding protein PstB [Nitrososphaerales archaeon]
MNVEEKEGGPMSEGSEQRARANDFSVNATETMEGPAKLRSDDLKAYFGKNEALHGISFSIRPNRVTAIIGPSGCGKSTFLRCLNRMHELTPGARATGQVLLDGENIYAPKTDPVLMRRRIGMVFQKPNPFPTMDIYDNVAAGLKLTGMKKGKNLDDIVKNSLQQASLWDEVKDDLHKPGTSISGGQQQRLCIARTIAMQPEVILMDEPCSALDPIATSKVEELMVQLKSTYTVVVVTHNMQQAARVADYTAFFYLGKLIETGPTTSLFEKPR